MVETICMKFLGTKIRNVSSISISSAEYAHRMVKVKTSHLFMFFCFCHCFTEMVGCMKTIRRISPVVVVIGTVFAYLVYTKHGKTNRVYLVALIYYYRSELLLLWNLLMCNVSKSLTNLPIYAEYTLLPQFFGRVYFHYKGCLLSFWSPCFIYIPVLNANSCLRHASDLGLYCLPIPIYGTLGLKVLK